ncbi:MAG: hypothetical protein ACOC90_05440 [Bacteroidota bacterium]
MRLYDELRVAGIELADKGSDLFFPVTDKSTSILNQFPVAKEKAKIINCDGIDNYMVPGAFPDEEEPDINVVIMVEGGIVQQVTANRIIHFHIIDIDENAHDPVVNKVQLPDRLFTDVDKEVERIENL